MIRERVRQFWEAGTAPADADFALARAWLSGPLYELFAGQHPRDIVHSAGTARWLVTHGHSARGLIEAAFLHDVGKGHQRRWDRAGYVMLQRVGAGSVAAAADSRWAFRRAVARSIGHAETSAVCMAAAGADGRALDLTRRHHEPAGSDGVLALLQQADAAN